MSVVRGQNVKIATFEDLEVFRRAYRVSLEVHHASLRFPAIEQHGLADQIRRASNRSAATLPRVLASSGGRVPSSSAIC